MYPVISFQPPLLLLGVVMSSVQASASFSQEQCDITLPLSLPDHCMGYLQKQAFHIHVQLEACSETLTNGRQELMNKCFSPFFFTLVQNWEINFIRLLKRYQRISQPMIHSLGQLNNASLYWLFLLFSFISPEPLILFPELKFSDKVPLS